MPSTSLVKFMNQKSSRGQPLGWGRSDIDGAPMRGPQPLASSDELDDRLVKVKDPNVRMFDLSRDDDTQAYLAAWDRIANGWAQLLFVDRKMTRIKKSGRLKMMVYMEWLEPYMEDGQPMQSQRPYIGRPNDD